MSSPVLTMTVRCSGATTCCNPCTSLVPPVPPVKTTIMYATSILPAVTSVLSTLVILSEERSDESKDPYLTFECPFHHRGASTRVRNLGERSLSMTHELDECSQHEGLILTERVLSLRVAIDSPPPSPVHPAFRRGPTTPSTNSGYTGNRCFNFCPAASVRRCKSSRCGHGASGLM